MEARESKLQGAALSKERRISVIKMRDALSYCDVSKAAIYAADFIKKNEVIKNK